MNIDGDHNIVPIDITRTSQIQHPQETIRHSFQKSSSPVLIQSIEMPLHNKKHKMISPNPSTNIRNMRQRRTFLFKAGTSLFIILLLAVLVAFNTSGFTGEEKGLLKKKFLGTYNNNSNIDNNDGLPNYAPIQSQDEATKVQATKTQHGGSETKEEAEGEPAISKSAAEALVCPQPVINFVINATDAKDECDGLRKAFDKTCAWRGEERHDTKGTGGRRRLSHFSLEKTSSTWIEHSKQYIQSITPKPSSRRRLEETNEETLKDFEDDTEMNGTNEDQIKAKSQESETIHISPSLPTGSGHMSDQMAQDVLGLNTELSDIAKAIEELGNATHTQKDENDDEHNSRQESEHHHDANKEKKDNKDLTSAAVAVSAIINNPDVIATQACCKSILQVFHDECDSPDGEEYADRRLFVIVCVIGLCGLIKSLIRHFHIRWLPEAGGCILVGVIGGLFLKLLPNIDFAFSHDMFLRVMVPPIVFEAALNINKRSFKQMLIPIVILALFGTIMSALLTAAIVYYGSHFIQHCTSIPFIESLTFGALISSIDPIAVLSVLSNMGMSDKDQIYVIIFGESLLNDGVAIVLFQTLLNFMDENLVIDGEAVYLATLQFLLIAFGSLFVGFASGLSATLYFWLMQGIQTPLVEVMMFIIWAFIPYYVCDGVEWSGIVAIVAAGFFMDIYIIGHKNDQDIQEDAARLSPNKPSPTKTPARVTKKQPVRHAMFSCEGFLSAKAKNHIRFVTEINSTLMETAIFCYLGIFLFNKRYHWSFWIPTVAIFACLWSRTVSVWFFSFVSNVINRLGIFPPRRLNAVCGNQQRNERPNQFVIDGRMQTVLIFAGLRGAMSFALVETIPLFDESTRQGSRYKPELKAMTSACIMFTVFVLGGYTDYLLERLEMKPANRETDVEMVSLIGGSNEMLDQWSGEDSTNDLKQRSIGTRTPIAHDDVNTVVRSW